MKKIGLVLICSIAALGITLVGAGLYVKANIKQISSRLTGFEFDMADLEVRYFPPAIQVKGLVLNHEGHSVDVPSLKLYPDLSKLLSGKILLKNAVLEKPTVVADASAKPEIKAAPTRSEPFSVASIPARRVLINDGRFSLKGPGGAILPAALTGEIETTAEGIAVHVKSAVIEELELQFSGKIMVLSLSPLKLTVNAQESHGNLSAIIDFLVRFGYLTTDMTDMIPRIPSLHAKGIALVIDQLPEAETMAVSLESLDADQTQLVGMAVKIEKDGPFSVSLSQATLDVDTVYRWVFDNPSARESLETILAGAKLTGFEARGNLTLTSLMLSGHQHEPQRLKGSANLRTSGLVIRVFSEMAGSQQFTIQELESEISIADGKPSLQVNRLTIRPQAGGDASLSGRVSFPLTMENLQEMTVTAKAFKVFGNTLNLTAQKPTGPQLTFDIGLTNPALTLLSKGVVRGSSEEQLDLETRLDFLQIIREPSEAMSGSDATTAGNPKPFDLSILDGKQFAAEVVIKNFQVNDFPQIRNFRARVHLGNDTALLRGNFILCNLNVGIDSLLKSPSSVTTQVEGKAINVDLTSLVACFSNTLPVFLAGRASLSATLFAKGSDPDTLLGNADGDLMITLSECGVHRLRNLDYRLSFLLDMLKIAGLEAKRLDSINFSKASARANLREGRLVFSSFSLTGPLLSAWGKGELAIKEKRLRISGQIRSGLGLTKVLEIDRVLAEKEV